MKKAFGITFGIVVALAAGGVALVGSIAAVDAFTRTQMTADCQSEYLELAKVQREYRVREHYCAGSVNCMVDVAAALRAARSNFRTACQTAGNYNVREP